MSHSTLRWTGLLPLALVVCLPAGATGQGNPYKTAPQGGAYQTQPPAYHTAVVGKTGASWVDYAPGYDKRVNGAHLHTQPSVNAGASAPAFSSASPYSINTFTPYYPPYGVWQPPTGAALQGLASLTSATGQYYQDVQQARLMREQSRQASLETTRQRLQLEMEYEANRPTAPRMAAAERVNSLDWARNYASRTEIASGNTLNVLLKSVLAARNPVAGPNVPLDTTTLRGINLTDKSTRGNLTMTKDEGKVFWTEALEDASFDAARDSFSKNFAKATEYINLGKTPDRTLIRELRGDLKKLEDQLDDQVADLAPSRYIESRRLVNQLKDTVKGMADPRLCKACHGDWRKGVRNISELVNYCMKNGVEFGPAAAPGDWAAYSATYYALRSYEREVAPQ